MRGDGQDAVDEGVQGGIEGGVNNECAESARGRERLWVNVPGLTASERNNQRLTHPPTVTDTISHTHTHHS